LCPNRTPHSRRCVHALARKRGPKRSNVSQVWAPTSAGANGDCGCAQHEQRARRLRHLSYSIVKQRIAFSEITCSQKKIAPCSSLWARRSPTFPSLRFPSGEGVGAPTGRIARIAPGGVSGLLRTMGVKRHAPRLAARQRGILAFMPLTVVGPGRLLVADEA